MIWRNANGKLSIEAYIVVAFACLCGGVAGIYWTRQIDAPQPVSIIFTTEVQHASQ